MSRFDRYTWRPEICNTAKDIYRILTSLDTKNKKIKRIVPIGMAENMKRDGYEWKYREILLGIGMTNEQLQSYPYAAQVLFPCELHLCEPVIILFDDGSTLEMKPNGGSALLVAANQISPDTVCGTNEPNFDPNILFDSLRGCSIEDIRILRNVAVDSCGHSDYEEKTELITFELVLSGDRGLFFRQSWDDWFTFGTTDSRWCRRGKINISSIPYALIEQAAYNIAGGGVPVSTVGAFVFGEKAEFTRVKPTVKPKPVISDFGGIFPEFVLSGLKNGIMLFDRKIKGFADKSAVLTAPETRSSSPVRIVRNEELCSVSCRGVYPCGEGAGYAGGIMSAAADGLKTAEKIIENSNR